MPIYEYDCPDCTRRVSLFFRTVSAAAAATEARCPRCGGARLQRRVSRVAVLRPEASRLDDFADDASLMGALENEDPRAMAGMMRKMSEEMGEPLDDATDEMVSRLEAGESPEAIDAAMPHSDDDAALSDLDD
jgi:putative FmdB family regulatory protein